MATSDLEVLLGDGPLERVVHFTGDEADVRIDTVPSEKAVRTRDSWRRRPEVATYLGGSRHRHNGAFAGVADIQGMDIYPAACPPYITDTFPLLRSSYDYAVAVRQNHAPWPTWIYTQGFSSAWRTEGGWVRAPNDTEAELLAMSVVAAASKGLMYFQTNLGHAERYPDTWARIGATNRGIRAIRELLVAGDAIGAQVEGGEVAAQAIASSRAVVVTALNFEVEQPIDLARCILEENPHWVLAGTEATLRFDLPADSGVVDVFELRLDEVVDPVVQPRVDESGTIALPWVPLSDDVPTRTFVFAADDQVRAEVEAVLASFEAR